LAKALGLGWLCGQVKEFKLIVRDNGTVEILAEDRSEILM
jgi:hypothetical protein